MWNANFFGRLQYIIYTYKTCFIRDQCFFNTEYWAKIVNLKKDKFHTGWSGNIECRHVIKEYQERI